MLIKVTHVHNLEDMTGCVQYTSLFICCNAVVLKQKDQKILFNSGVANRFVRDCRSVFIKHGTNRTILSSVNIWAAELLNRSPNPKIDHSVGIFILIVM